MGRRTRDGLAKGHAWKDMSLLLLKHVAMSLGYHVTLTVDIGVPCGPSCSS